ncbi:MAG: OprO/OprP family phosphate-selective porin [Bacteroidia bacterium]|nr:OprO/OprP family phosphate-selective porin [Bacteroidia bacterium]
MDEPRMLLPLTLILILRGLFAQNESDERPLLRIDQGISFSQDSLFSLNLRFRMQNRFGYLSQLDDTATAGYDIRVRRLRLRLDGLAPSLRLSYYIQLSFSAGDQDYVEGFALNIVRDAMVYYTVSPSFYIGLGQSKLPGNRQRVISSGNLQMPERSYANQFYTLDRDVGIFFYKTVQVGAQQFQLKGAITGGEGRLSGLSNTGLAYTLRWEYLPFGSFQNTGDYSEGDLDWEPSPRLSIGATYSLNQRALRAGGQLGQPLYSPTDITTLLTDAILKYRGWCISVEVFQRVIRPTDPFDPSVRSIYSGYAWNLQVSKIWRRQHEIAFRWTEVCPSLDYRLYQAYWRTRAIAYNYYLRGHRIKAQLYLGLDDRTETLSLRPLRNRVSAILQVEFGI